MSIPKYIRSGQVAILVGKDWSTTVEEAELSQKFIFCPEVIQILLDADEIGFFLSDKTATKIQEYVKVAFNLTLSTINIKHLDVYWLSQGTAFYIRRDHAGDEDLIVRDDIEYLVA